MANNDDSNAVISRIDENVQLFRAEQKEFNREIKEGLKALENKFDGKHEMTQKDLNNLDKRVTRVEDFHKILKWAFAIIGGIILTVAAYAMISSIVEYVSSYGIP